MQENNQLEEFKLTGDGSASNSLPVPLRVQLPAENKTESRAEEEPTGRSSRPKKKKKISKDNSRRRQTKKKADPAPAEPEEGGSASKHKEPEAYCERALPTAKPLWESADLHSSEGFHGQIDRQYFCAVTLENLQQLRELGSSPVVHINELLNERTESLRINEERAQKYLQFLKDTSRQSSGEVVVLFEENGRFFELFYEIGSSGELELTSFLQLNESEYHFLKLRQGYLSKLEDKLQQYRQQQQQQPPVEVDEISRQMLFFNSLLLQESRQVKERGQQLQQLMSQYKEPEPILPSQLAQWEDQGMRLLLKKNLVSSLKPKRFEVLNYFRSRAAIEQNKSFEPLTTLRDLMDYVRKKVVRKNKKTKYPLPTGCLGCLSDRYEQCNPFKNCYECGSRFHKNCLVATQNICTVCDGKRLKRTLSNECELCPNRGLMFKRVSDDKNIHVWCMLAFNLYEVRSLQVLYRSDNKDDDMDAGHCFICNGHRGRLVRCVCSTKHQLKTEQHETEQPIPFCGKQVHPLCAYLHGYHLELNGSTIEFDCQTNSSPQFILEQEFLRKYTVNFGKTAYTFFSLEEFERSKQPRPPTIVSEDIVADDDEVDAQPLANPLDNEAQEPFLSE